MYIADKWINIIGTICSMEYYSAVKKNEVLAAATTWMNLGNMLGEISLTQKGTKGHIVVPFVEKIQGRQIHRDRPMSGCWGITAYGHSVLFGVTKCLGTGYRRWWHSLANVLKASVLYTLKWLVLSCGFYLNLRNRRIPDTRGLAHWPVASTPLHRPRRPTQARPASRACLGLFLGSHLGCQGAAVVRTSAGGLGAWVQGLKHKPGHRPAQRG